ncbi:MAG TPA: D-alanyl-D-alanine carboxypeptidase [Candidatus Anaerotruncus excrementipullorum]|uniref:serine-type D-Ala-D-Ala carboxypeptidase n=1 Tax=Candidatus Anaerotruncus excrementipullorum TaxID=2838465 RepID=A0A9D1WRX4_9FIRM|nr:D-alanyl-D-alanine carboxypeptidase [Candidatus Anaerotruncus excrementipullorum]
MSRRVLAAVLAAALAVAAGTPTWAAGEGEALGQQLPAQAAVLLETEGGRVLLEKNPDTPLAPASVTKVMTLLLVMEALDQGQLALDQEVACSEHAASMGGSQIWLEPGERMTVEDLLKATAIASANDASVALAELIAGSEGAFVERMNQRAQELGMENTHFENATGLDAEGHLSTARDIAIMSRALLTHPKIKDYSTVWMDTLRDGQTQLVNTNKLVRFYEGCTGLKTGTTDAAGSCLAASAQRDGLELVAVVLGSPSSDERFSAARALLDYGFANYVRLPLPAPQAAPTVPVTGGVAPQVAWMSKGPGAVVVRAADRQAVEQQVELAEDLQAPVELGQILGRVTVTAGGSPVCEYELVAAEAVEEMTFSRALGRLVEGLLRL